MSARDDYPLLRTPAIRTLVEQRSRMCDEIDRLRARLSDAVSAPASGPVVGEGDARPRALPATDDLLADLAAFGASLHASVERLEMVVQHLASQAVR